MFVVSAVSPLVFGVTIKISDRETSQSIESLDGPMDSPWSTLCHDNHHTGRSPYSTANVTNLEKWRFYTPGWVQDGAVIDNDGIIYFGDFDWRINAIYPNGTRKWIFDDTDGWINSVPALAEDGTIYAGCWDDYLYALNPDGTKKWSMNTGGTIASSPVIGNDGTIYVGNMNNIITAFNPNGTKKWTYNTGDFITSSPAVGDDGTVYIGSGDDYLYALNPNGTLKWRYKTGDWIKGPPSVANDGTIYVGSYDDYVHALHPNGTMIWKCKVGRGTETNPSIGPDGTIYVGRDELYAIYPNGTLKWSFDLGSDRHIHMSSPGISNDGTIYVGTHIGETSGGDIIAVNPDGTERWRKKIASTGWVDFSPCIGEDGTVYIGTSTDVEYEPGKWRNIGYLHAFGPVESNVPPNTPTITGKTNGKVGEEYGYYFTSIDSDNNPVRFYIEWGDGYTEWTREVASGEKTMVTHKFSEEGNFTIRAKAQDTLDEESGWGELNVTITKKSKVMSSSLLLWFLERYPLLNRLLTLIMR